MGDRGKEPEQRNLQEMCFQAVREHFHAVGIEGILGLPSPLITDLLPHLTICQLDEIQPALNKRGISTYPGWIGVLRDMCGPKHVIDLHTEDEAKHQVMRMLFTVVFYGFTNFYVKKNIKNLTAPSFLWAAAKCVTQFLLDACLNDRLQRLIAKERPLLDLFEKRMTSVVVSHSLDLSKEKNQAALYVFHRLVDHGVVNRLVILNDCPFVLAWLLHERGSQYVHSELKELMLTRKKSCSPQGTSDRASCSSLLAGRAAEDLDDHAMPCKRPKTNFVSSEEEEGSGTTNFDLDPEVLCKAFAPCDDQPAGTCPRGQINCLEFSNCRSESLKVLNSALPTFFSLRSLILHSYLTFKDSDVFNLAKSLRQLSESSCSSLTNLSVSALPYTKLMKVLLNANSKMKSLHVEINNVVLCTQVPESDMSDIKAELPLEKLTVKVTEFQTDLQLITSVLRQAPHLTTLYISESNPCLKSLHLEDMNLSDCLPEIIHLLQNCKLEELRLNDCRLLEKWSNKKGCLRQLMTALKRVPSLHTLSLAQNRLAKAVCVLAELFSGSSPALVKRLDISSNFIQPADLLEFAETLRTHHLPHRLTLDLRKNPGDRDSDTWDTALKTLPPFCILLVEGWVSTNTMADHISNM